MRRFAWVVFALLTTCFVGFPAGESAGWSLGTDLGQSQGSYLGEVSGDRAGNHVAGVGDLNGDGYTDFIIGAYGNDDAGTSAGQTYVIFGAAGGWALDTDLSLADASYLGEDADDYCGLEIAAAGNVNGDGYQDFIIGSYTNSERSTGAGQTYLILGSNGGWAMDTSLSQADASFHGEAMNDGAGQSVSGAGDVNGDGYDDFIIGAPGNDNGGDSTGQTYLILGASGGWTTDEVLDTADGSFLGDNQGDRAGTVVEGVGDVDGDGYDDFLIAAPNNDDGASEGGCTYLVLGQSGGWAMDTPIGNADASFLGEGANDQAGMTLAGAGDVDDDGYDDFLIGSQTNDDAGPDAGQVYLILGRPAAWSMAASLGNADASFLGEVAGDAAGQGLAGVGDLDADGFDDFFVGSVNSSLGGYQAGQAYLIFGDTGGWSMDRSLSTADASFIGESSYSAAGISTDGLGDVDGDGLQDWLIGASWSGDNGSYAGQVYVLLGPEPCIDADGDGFGDPGMASCYGGLTADCDDGDPLIYPGADEYCDGLDNDCDGITDEADAIDAVYYHLDADGDGYGDPVETQLACDAPPGYVLDGTDCDDADANVSPGADEVCDWFDNDCNGLADDNAVDATTWYEDLDGDSFGNPAVTMVNCSQLIGYSAAGTDCDDTDPDVYPGALERCNGNDDDCDGQLPADEADADGDGVMECDGDCDDNDGDLYPGNDEDCDDGIDNDCDDAVDGMDSDCLGDDDDATDDDDSADDDDTGDDDTGDDDTADDDDVGDDDSADDDDVVGPGGDCDCRMAEGRPGPFALAGLLLLVVGLIRRRL